jgi:hypothetical protein
MSDIKNIIDQSNWADRTKKNRISFLTTLREELDPNSKNLNFLKDFSNVSDFLLSKYDNPNTRKNKVLDLRSILNLIGDDKTIKKYDLLNQILIKDSDDFRANNIIQDKNKDKIISYSNLLELPKIISDNIIFVYSKLFLNNEDINNLKSIQAKYKYLKNLTEYMISSLYLNGDAPVRANWSNVQIDKHDNNINWYDSKTGFIHWNQFKNIKSFGPRSWKLSTNNVKNLNNYLKVLKHIINDPHYVLYQIPTTTTFHSFTPEKFSTYFKKINIKYLKKPLTINDYRKIYESHIINNPNYNNLTNEDKNKIHERLLHSTSTAQSDYLKIENPISLKQFQEESI